MILDGDGKRYPSNYREQQQRKKKSIEIVAAWYAIEGNIKYRYMKYYDEYGVYRLKKEKVGVVSHRKKPSNTQKRRRTSPPRKREKNTSRPKPKPKHTKKQVRPPKPKPVAKPVFNMKKPKPPGKFVFNKPKPRKKEVTIPAPPKHPGPQPTFMTEKRKEIKKLEYVIGIRELAIKHKQYEHKSIYVSKPIEVEGNVMQVSLHAVEEHPLFDELNGKAASRQTSVEYYIAYTENPQLHEWHPILPEGQTRVQCELLIFNTARTADLRFPAYVLSDPQPKVYKNGVVLPNEKWAFVNGGRSIQLLEEVDPVSIYTIDYTPNTKLYNPWVLDIYQKGLTRKTMVETFPNGTNHNKTIVLSKYPYIDYEIINQTPDYNPNTHEYKPIQVRLKNASIAGPNRTTFKEVGPYQEGEAVYTYNVTDYRTGEWKQLRPYSLSPDDRYLVFEYQQDKNKLYFSETFNKADIYTNQEVSHGNAEIEVTYEYLAAQFRVKMILRRNSTNENTLTPIVREYALKFKVMK